MSNGLMIFCAGSNDLPFLDFKKLDSKETPLSSRNEELLSTSFVNEKIEDVLLIQDQAKVFEGKTYCQQMDSTEGIIIVTEKCQYGFLRKTCGLILK